MTKVFHTEKEIRRFWYELAHCANEPFRTTYGWLHTDARGRAMEVHLGTKDMCEHILVLQGDNIKATWTGDYAK